MKEINFDSGLTIYSLNGKCEVSFNPTDSNFVERLYSSFEDLDKKQESYKAQIEKMADKRQIFEFAKERDAEMRDIIDSVFEAPVSEAVFGGMNVYAIANGSAHNLHFRIVHRPLIGPSRSQHSPSIVHQKAHRAGQVADFSLRLRHDGGNVGGAYKRFWGSHARKVHDLFVIPLVALHHVLQQSIEPLLADIGCPPDGSLYLF